MESIETDQNEMKIKQCIDCTIHGVSALLHTHECKSAKKDASSLT